jgi:predicted GTPase
VLIAEACTHSPLSEDIGRIKIPNWLKQKLGAELSITITSGMDFPKDLTKYDLIIHCGACMFNRKYVLSRIEEAKQQKVPITNYGIAIAHLHGILDKLSFCRKK